jgi:hypothetical protein
MIVPVYLFITGLMGSLSLCILISALCLGIILSIILLHNKPKAAVHPGH